MTYWGYHLIFTLPVIAVLIYCLRKRIHPAHWACFGVICVIVFIFTAPWDNYAVYLGIWGFGDGVSLGYPVSHLAKTESNPDGLTWLGHIPFEEYAFFFIESAIVCLLMLIWLPKPAR